MLLGIAVMLGVVGAVLTYRSRKAKRAERKACEAFAIRYGRGRFRVTVEDDEIEGI